MKSRAPVLVGILIWSRFGTILSGNSDSGFILETQRGKVQVNAARSKVNCASLHRAMISESRGNIVTV